MGLSNAENDRSPYMLVGPQVVDPARVEGKRVEPIGQIVRCL